MVQNKKQFSSGNKKTTDHNMDKKSPAVAERAPSSSIHQGSMKRTDLKDKSPTPTKKDMNSRK